MKRGLAFWFGVLFLLVAMLAWHVQPAYARSQTEDKVIFGGTYVLPSGETLQGDLLVLDGSATIAQGAQVMGDVSVLGGKVVIFGDVEGDLVVTGGSARVLGTVAGDMVVIGGMVDLGPRAVIQGDLRHLGSVVVRAPGAQVLGQENGWGDWTPTLPWHRFTLRSPLSLLWHWIWVGIRSVFRAVLLAALAALLALFAERATRKVMLEATTTTLVAGGVGLLTYALLPVVFVVFAITIVLLPLALILVILMGVAVLYGWLSLGWVLGDKLAEAFHQQWHPTLSAALGTFLLTLLADSLRVVPCVGWVPGFLVSAVGAGAVMLAAWEAYQHQHTQRKAVSVAGQLAEPAAPPAESAPPEEEA